MIYTGYYAKVKHYEENGLTPIAISAKVPDWFTGLHWKELSPSWSIFSQWQEVHNEFIYNDRFSKEILSKINKNEFRYKLLEIENPILLCYEKDGFCHRHIVADWIEQNLGLLVEEFKC